LFNYISSDCLIWIFFTVSRWSKFIRSLCVTTCYTWSVTGPCWCGPSISPCVKLGLSVVNVGMVLLCYHKLNLRLTLVHVDTVRVCFRRPVEDRVVHALGKAWHPEVRLTTCVCVGVHMRSNKHTHYWCNNMTGYQCMNTMWW